MWRWKVMMAGDGVTGDADADADADADGYGDGDGDGDSVDGYQII